jgi:predicted DNA-binding protein
MTNHTLAVDLPDEMQMRLKRLAREAGRSEADCIREAITDYLEDWEDYRLAEARMKTNLPAIPLDEVERRLELED